MRLSSLFPCFDFILFMCCSMSLCDVHVVVLFSIPMSIRNSWCDNTCLTDICLFIHSSYGRVFPLLFANTPFHYLT